ncbi:MAG TPA: GDP-mannose 4,6-dehydratase [Candidatus Syntrophosphaera sp.]|nr:GDP-mannose 4,6-dehydratase [Candidatus Syntrophosphaera sp.]
MKQPEQILVTGGAGFIGSHLCEALLGKGYEVVCLDNFYPSYEPSIKKRNIAQCGLNPRFTLVRADICDSDELREKLAKFTFAAVIHLAALAGVRPSVLEPERYARVNVLGTLNLLQYCEFNHISRFIFASSSSIYGNDPHIPFSESDPVDNPISPYAATKKAGELLCHTWHNLHKISVLCLRFFTVYGPRQRPDLAIHKFAAIMARNGLLPIYGDGSSSRDYTYIDDLIDGVLAALDYVREHFCFEIVNLGNDRSVSLNEMLATLEKVTGLTARRETKRVQEGDVLHTRADISKARQLLNYAPQTGFEEGVGEFWEWWQEENRISE